MNGRMDGLMKEGTNGWMGMLQQMGGWVDERVV